VETEGAVVQKELPFVVGVIGDFSGAPTSPLPPLKDRKFVAIDRDNFNEVLERMRPALSFKVPNLLKGDGSELPVQLDFESIDDFEPGAVARRISHIAALLDVRNKLQELLTKTDRSPELENLLEQIVQNENMRKELTADMEHDAPTTKTEDQTAASPEEKNP
jgi:type VI secretion system protein ImpB